MRPRWTLLADGVQSSWKRICPSAGYETLLICVKADGRRYAAVIKPNRDYQSETAYKAMQLKFVPVEEFYFALTLAVRTLDDLTTPELAEQVEKRLRQEFGQPSTVAAASQNTYNYVFRVHDVDNSPANQLILSIADWQGNLRLSSDYGWALDAERKPVRTDKFNQRPAFSQQVRAHLQHWLQLSFAD